MSKWVSLQMKEVSKMFGVRALGMLKGRRRVWRQGVVVRGIGLEEEKCAAYLQGHYTDCKEKPRYIFPKLKREKEG